MTKKLLAILISLMCLLSVFCSYLGVNAATAKLPVAENGARAPEDESVTVTENTTTTKVTTTKATTPQAPSTKPTQRVTTTRDFTTPTVNLGNLNTSETTRRTTTTGRPNTGNNTTRETTRREDTNPPVNATITTTTPTTTEESLPAGSFFVYVEKNNGEPRLKRVMAKKGLVPEPNEPVRDGYIFQGWYRDPEFKKQWNFFTDDADEGTIIYAKWSADPGSKQYKITVKDVVGGKVEVNPNTASLDEYVIINVTPDEGKRLVAGSVTINGRSTDVLSFLMPAKNVVIDARFEDIPAEEQVEDEKNLLPFIIGGIVLVLAIVIIIVISARRRNDISEEDIDENGTIIDNDDDDDWFDDTITIEDGFKEGERVIGNYVPEDDSQEVDIDDMQ